ncbi:MAG: sulfatase/phosphatase domain-containing protein, partial [Planctomycetota bacterium]
REFITKAVEGKYIEEPIISKVGDKTVIGGKGRLTDAGTKVPLIANWPGTTPVGKVCDDLIDFSDFMPTFAELAGATPPKDRVIDGVSFASQLMGKRGNPREWKKTPSKNPPFLRRATLPKRQASERNSRLFLMI